MAYFPPNPGTDTAKTGKGALKCETESQTLVAANRDRVALRVSNIDETNSVYLALGAEAAVAEEGPCIKAGSSEIIDYYTGEIRAISKAGEPLLTYSEV